MNWEAIGAVGEILGAAGVIITLIYLASQIRQNTRATRSQSVQSLAESGATMNAMIIEDLGMVGFWKMATMVPAELSAKMDRLTIGILPVRMKKFYIFGAARWMQLMMAFMKPFLGKKMRERMVILPRKTDMQKFCDDLVSRKNIPSGFSGLEGDHPLDVVINKFK